MQADFGGENRSPSNARNGSRSSTLKDNSGSPSLSLGPRVPSLGSNDISASGMKSPSGGGEPVKAKRGEGALWPNRDAMDSQIAAGIVGALQGDTPGLSTSRPGSRQGDSSSRPGSGGGRRPSVNSMTRLPDDPPGGASGSLSLTASGFSGSMSSGLSHNLAASSQLGSNPPRRSGSGLAAASAVAALTEKSSGSAMGMMRLPADDPVGSLRPASPPQGVGWCGGPGRPVSSSQPSRPGSTGPQNRKPSLTRLPDEAMGQRSSLPTASTNSTANGSANVDVGAQLRGEGGGPSSRPGTPSGLGGINSGTSTFARQITPPTPGVLRWASDHNEGAGLGGLSGNASGRMNTPGPGNGRSSAMRDRLNKNLTVKTNAQLSLDRPQKQVFRTLAEGQTIDDFYDFGEEIYSGGAKGKVLCAINRLDNREVVVKIRTKRSNRSGERTWRTIMTQVNEMNRGGTGNAHILGIEEIVEDPTAFYVVMPKCNGGELFEFLVTETEVPEAECKRILREILTAIGHLHKNNLIHRDVKPENIMFDLDARSPQSSKTVKLIDFDTCVEWTPATPKSLRFVGTPGYIAPEALLGEVNPKSDLWSVGVILYILMTGETPWTSLVSLEDGTVGSPGANKMYAALKQEKLEWDKEPWPDFPLARDLCQKLLAFNMEDRLNTVHEALEHGWLTDIE